MKTTLRNATAILSLCVTLDLCAAVATAAAGQPAVLVPAASIEMANSTGKFDFLRVDARRHRLLAAHENDGTADYFDMQKNTLITRLRVGGAVDTAQSDDGKLYFVSVQEAQRVAIVDADTLRELKSVATPGPTDAILYLPGAARVYVTHDNGAEVWVIDPAKAAVVATIVVPGVPEYMVYDAQAARIYLNIKDKNLVAVIDPAAGRVVAEWPTAPVMLPHGLALDAAAHRLYSAGGNGKLVAIDTTTGKVSGTIDIADKVDQIAFDPVQGRIYSAGAGHMSVTGTTHGRLTALGEVSTAATARNVAVDPATHAVWSTYTDGSRSFARSWLPAPR